MRALPPPIRSPTTRDPPSTTARRDPRLTPTDARYFEERAYLGLLEAAVANGATDPHAFERLAEIETLVRLDPEFRQRARLDAYSRAHVEAVSDHD